MYRGLIMAILVHDPLYFLRNILIVYNLGKFCPYVEYTGAQEKHLICKLKALYLYIYKN